MGWGFSGTLLTVLTEKDRKYTLNYRSNHHIFFSCFFRSLPQVFHRQKGVTLAGATDEKQLAKSLYEYFKIENDIFLLICKTFR